MHPPYNNCTPPYKFTDVQKADGFDLPTVFCIYIREKIINPLIFCKKLYHLYEAVVYYKLKYY